MKGNIVMGGLVLLAAAASAMHPPHPTHSKHLHHPAPTRHHGHPTPPVHHERDRQHGNNHTIEIPLKAKGGFKGHHRRGRAVDGPIPLTGCEQISFFAPVTIGQGAAAQTFELVVDTGSSTLAVAGNTCTTGCTNVSPRYLQSTHQANGAVNTMGTISSTYYDGTSWNATIWEDTVTVGTASLPDMKIGIITSAGGYFRTDCNGDQPPPNQGIMG